MLEVRGCHSIARAGEPALPVHSLRFILPPGETVSRVSVEADDAIVLPGEYDIAPMPPQAPTGGPASPGARSEAVYASTEPIPAERAALALEGAANGVRVAFVNVYPCAYVPARKRVIFSRSLRVVVETAAAAGAPPPAKPRPKRALELLGATENPEAALAYVSASPDGRDPNGAEEQADYVIVTSPAFAPSFEPLAALRRRLGMRVRIVDTAWIAAAFPGNDQPARIRSFIIYAYENWNTRYVLLGGDDEIVPHRGLYAKTGTTIDADIASDLYYAGLDGTWNADGDAYFGEPGEEDLLPEVSVGRLPVDSAAEIANVVEKIRRYSEEPVLDQCESALMLGELLWSSGGVTTWGGDYKDEIRYGSSSWGFTTAGPPASFETATLYDRDLGSWGPAQLVPLLSSGVNLVNHCGHASYATVMRLAAADVPSIANDGVEATYFLCWSHGCYAASFDNRDDAGVVHAEDCIAEELLCGPRGAVAFVGHTRLGWDAPASTCGVSQLFDRRFFDALFGRGIVRLGEALDDSRVANVAYVPYDTVRWVYYTLCLLGDPAMAAWTARPAPLTVAHEETIYRGQSGFEAIVTDAAGPVVGARVTLGADAPAACREGITDADGRALIAPAPDAPPALLLSVVATNRLPYVDTIAVADAAPALCAVTLDGIRDDGADPAGGDGDGIAEPGERIALAITLRNGGLVDLSGITVALASADTTIVVSDGIFDVGSLAAGASVSCDTALCVAIRDGIEGARGARIEFAVTAAEGSWLAPADLPIAGPAIVLESWETSDDLHGDGDGCLEAWEFQNLRCVYRNAGPTEVRSPRVALSIPDYGVARVIDGSAEAELLAAGASLSLSDELLFFVNESTPPFASFDLVLSFGGDNIVARRDTIRVRACGVALDSPADAEEPFTHLAIIGTDQWHVSGDRSYSPPASWKCGGAAGAAYANLMEAVLTLPPLCLYSASTLTFRHRMTAEAGTVSPYWALDAGVVELSQDGGRTWRILTPVAPYPSRASPYNTIFLAAYQRCWSGSFDWRAETVDLSAYAGPALLRFHFASDERNGLEGWYIDDIRVTTVVPTDADGAAAGPAADRLLPPYPNPFNPAAVIPYEAARAGRAELSVFDVSGRLVRALVRGAVDAGRHAAVWDGKDEAGRNAASGVYFCRFTIGSYTASTRLVLLR